MLLEIGARRANCWVKIVVTAHSRSENAAVHC